MATDDHIEALRLADPAHGITDGPLDELARTELARILREDSRERSSPHWINRRTLLAGVAAATAAAVGLIVVDPFASAPLAVAATPPLVDNVLGAGQPAKKALIQLALVTQENKSLPGDTGGRHFVRTESWSLSTRIDGKQVRSAVIPEIRELTWSADRSGHLTVRTGQPYFPSSKYQKDWANDHSPGKPGTVIRDETWQPGSFTPMFPNLPLPSNNTQLLGVLKAGHPIDELGTGELFVAVTDLYNESLPAAAVRSELLRLLAAQPDVVSLGRRTDRAGRPVQVVAVDSNLTGLPTRQLLMFDPTTGALLANEEILTKDAGKLQVTVPSVISYRLYYPIQ